MWYNSKGEHEPYIDTLTEGISKHLPMGYNPIHKKGGKKWYSGTDSREQLEKWFSILDVKELLERGYKLYKFTVKEWNTLEHEVLFTREGIIAQEEIPMSDLWDIE